MRSTIRFGAAALLAGGVLVATAATASAADSTSPADPCSQTGTYRPGTGCVLTVSDVRAGCTTDLDPYLSYTLSTPVPAQQVRVTVTDGTHTGQATGAPSGSVPWPASVTGRSATVTFTTQTEPVYTASVAVSTPPCASQVLVDHPSSTGSQPGDPAPGAHAAVPASTTPKTGGAKVLAFTGSQVGPVAGVAGGLLLLGSLVFLASRRRSA